MSTDTLRGSEKLMAAWKSRSLTEDAVREIATQFEKSPANIEGADVVGGSNPTGLRLTASYEGDDVPLCGNDILFWLKWHRTHGGSPRPPRIIIDGTPYPDLVQVQLDFGHVAPPRGVAEIPGNVTGGFRG